MSGRPTDWSAVGLPADPTPGDPAVVRDGAQRYLGVADAIKACAANLRALDAGDSSQAESVRALMETRDTIVDGVNAAEARYRSAGSALETYAFRLDQVQSDTLLALYAAQNAVAVREDATRRRRQFEELAEDYEAAADEHGQDQYALYTRLAGWADEDVADAEAEIGRQVEAIQTAVSERDQAAQNAIDAIKGAVEADGLSDSLWDDWGSKVIGWISAVAGAISKFAGILALVFAFIPVVGPVLAAGFGAIAAVTGVVAAMADIVLYVAGEKTLLEVVVSVGFAALGCVGLGGLRGAAGAVKNMSPKVLFAMGKATKGASLKGFVFGYGRNVRKAGAALAVGGLNAVRMLPKALRHPIQTVRRMHASVMEIRNRMIDMTKPREGRAMMTPGEREASRAKFKYLEGKNVHWDDIEGHQWDSKSSIHLVEDLEFRYGTKADGTPRSQIEWENEFLVWNIKDNSLIPDLPPNNGFVPGTEKVYNSLEEYLAAGHDLHVDRIGHPAGDYLAEAPGGVPISAEKRGIDPRGYDHPHYSYQITGSLDGFMIKVGEIAPALGSPGGGIQMQFIDKVNDNILNVLSLVDKGVLK